MFRTVGDCLKYALERGCVEERDFYTTDAEVLVKIERYLKKDEKLKLLFDRMDNKTEIIDDPKSYDARVYCKSRIVDPLFLKHGKMRRFSEVDRKWGRIVKEELKPKEYFLKFDK